MPPSQRHIAQASEPYFVMEDWHNIGADYDRTLMAWQQRFLAAWPTLQERYSERFFRMFNYYLCACAGAFRARDIQLWQVLFSPQGIAGGYGSRAKGHQGPDGRHTQDGPPALLRLASHPMQSAALTMQPDQLIGRRDDKQR